MAPLSCGEVHGGVQETLPRLSGGALVWGVDAEGRELFGRTLLVSLLGALIFCLLFLVWHPAPWDATSR
jgi:hypothetical protein